LKKIFLLTVSLSIFMFLTACGNDSGIEQISLKEFEEILEENQDQNILFYFDNDSNYLIDVENVSEEQEKSVKLYNPFESDGETPNKEEEEIYPDTLELDYNNLYQIIDGKVNDKLELDYYLGEEREKAIKNILK